MYSIRDMWAVIRNDARRSKELAVELYDDLVSRGVKMDGCCTIEIEKYRTELKEWEPDR